MPNHKKVLLFQIGKEKKKQLVTLCKALDITPVIVPRGQFGEVLGALAGIEGFSLKGQPYGGAGLSSEMIVFSGISSDNLDIFFQEYKKAGIEPVPLKAVLTSHNIFWDVKTLYQELEKEHRSLSNP